MSLITRYTLAARNSIHILLPLGFYFRKVFDRPLLARPVSRALKVLTRGRGETATRGKTKNKYLRVGAARRLRIKNF